MSRDEAFPAKPHRALRCAPTRSNPRMGWPCRCRLHPAQGFAEYRIRIASGSNDAPARHLWWAMRIAGQGWPAAASRGRTPGRAGDHSRRRWRVPPEPAISAVVVPASRNPAPQACRQGIAGNTVRRVSLRGKPRSYGNPASTPNESPASTPMRRCRRRLIGGARCPGIRRSASRSNGWRCARMRRPGACPSTTTAARPARCKPG